jgi:2-polyprenyl-6-methoxyphenol hydroxylase-like FAD-dependent oxidoreductase
MINNADYPKDDGSADETWAARITVNDLLARLPNTEEWDPVVLEFIRNTPENELIRWKLCWRDPQDKWTTPDGRILQLGDSAHAFIPSSIMGATATLEDAQSIAECLRLASKEDANIGVKVHELLRYVLL